MSCEICGLDHHPMVECEDAKRNAYYSHATPQGSTPESAGEALRTLGLDANKIFDRIREDLGRGLITEARSHLSFIDSLVEKEPQAATTVKGQKELLPCPFCGGDAEVRRIGSGRQSSVVCCTQCGCRLESNESDWNTGHNWNTRAPSVPSGNEEHTVYVRANDPAARELLKRAVKWIDRLNERKTSIPHFFDNDTDPAPLAKDIRVYLKTGGQP